MHRTKTAKTICKHPPTRLFTGIANNSEMKPTRWVGCCDCGMVLVGGVTRDAITGELK